MNQARHVLAIDQGTTSTRSIVFSDQARNISVAQREFQQHYPLPAGWSTMQRTSGATPWRLRAKRSPDPVWERAVWRPSASPISARPRWYGIAVPACPFIGL